MSRLVIALSNFKSMNNGHNKNILNEQEKPSPCNFRNKTSCPSEGIYQHKNLVLHFLVKCQSQIPDLKKTHPHYIGVTEHRLYKHNNSFNYESKKNSAELSSFIWGKKKEKINMDLDWSILDKAKLYSPASKKNSCYVLQRNITSFSFVLQ